VAGARVLMQVLRELADRP